MAKHKRTTFTHLEVDFAPGENAEMVSRRVADKLRTVKSNVFKPGDPHAIVLVIQKEGGSLPPPITLPPGKPPRAPRSGNK
jgi:hypothetical protein